MKTAGGAKSAAVNGAGQAAQVLGRAGLGGLCGVGFMWVLTVFYPPSKSYVLRFGSQLETLSRDYPVVALGLLLGMGAALLWQALRKG